MGNSRGIVCHCFKASTWKHQLKGFLHAFFIEGSKCWPSGSMWQSGLVMHYFASKANCCHRSWNSVVVCEVFEPWTYSVFLRLHGVSEGLNSSWALKWNYLISICPSVLLVWLVEIWRPNIIPYKLDYDQFLSSFFDHHLREHKSFFQTGEWSWMLLP